jgi:Na+/melibiose symporter-like transporter
MIAFIWAMVPSTRLRSRARMNMAWLAVIPRAWITNRWNNQRGRNRPVVATVMPIAMVIVTTTWIRPFESRHMVLLTLRMVVLWRKMTCADV